MHWMGSGRARRALVTVWLVCVVASVAGCQRVSRMLGREYEYEEDITLTVGGSATININASLAALSVLRGLPLDVNPRTRFAPEKVRAAFEAVGCQVTHVSSTPWVRENRRFVQVRLDFPDVRKAASCGVLAWSTYTFTDADGQLSYRQVVGMPVAGDAKDINWKGTELVGFKLHLPSKIRSHNVRDVDTHEPMAPERGNILTWEQYLKDRRIGTPLVMEMAMERESILYQTLWLFVGAIVTAVAVMGSLIIWVLRRKPKAS